MTTITALPTLDEGIEFRFRGIERNEAGEPIGELIDQVLIVPPLNLANLKRLKKFFGQSEPGGTALDVQSLENAAEILLPALSQNYSGVPRWLIEQSIKIDNVGELLRAVMDVSGLQRKALAEKKAMTTPNPTQASTSTTLSSTSSPPAAAATGT